MQRNIKGRIVTYFKLRFRKLFLVVFVTSVVSGIFLLYFFFVGIPKTQARNYFNLAVENINNGNYVEAESNLVTAISFWRENYIVEKLDEVQSNFITKN